MRRDQLNPLRSGGVILAQGADGVPIDPDHDYYEVTFQFGFDTAVSNALVWMRANQLDDVKKKIPSNGGPEHILVYVATADNIFWRVVKPEEDSLEGSVALNKPSYVNKNWEWLTYETVLNKPKFRKTNQERKVGFYAVKTTDMQVWVREDLKPGGEAFEALCASFFPDHSSVEVKQLSTGSWWWQQKDDVATLTARTAPYYEDLPALVAPLADDPALEPESRLDLTGSRAGLCIHLPRYVVMPYNYWDNGDASYALGTSPTSADDLTKAIKHPIPIFQIAAAPNGAAHWSVYRTASRSCIMKLGRIKTPDQPWPDKDWTVWPFGAADTERKTYKYIESKLPRFVSDKFTEEVNKAQRFSHRTKPKDDFVFSVKTGVIFVGFESQAGANKDVIGKDDEWFVGSMRSDTIQAMNILAGARGAARNDIVIQTEIMMILERNSGPGMGKRGVDGVALRDMTVIDPDKYYVPPLSIPFIDYSDMKTLTTEFAQIGDPLWRDFWQKNWAEAVGRAKAWFLVQYGMQHANPNVQNYLIEFSKDALTGPVAPVRIVIRDVADALLVREVAWALFGPNSACPVEEDTVDGKIINAHTELQKMRLPVLRYNFRTPEQGTNNETGSTEVKQFGTVGIQFLWQRFSTFYGGWKGKAKLDECPPPLLTRVLRMGTAWSIAHAASYVRTVEQALGHEFGAIRWDRLYDPSHHPDRYLVPSAADDPYQMLAYKDRQWEEVAALVIHNYFRDAGRAEICAYHNRGWKDATPKFIIQVVDLNAVAMPLTVVHYRSKDNLLSGMRITDREGKIPFYCDRLAADFDFQIGRGLFTDPKPPGLQDWKVIVEWTQERVALVAHSVTDITTVLTLPVPRAPEIAVLEMGAPLKGKLNVIQCQATADPGLSIQSVQYKLDGINLDGPVTEAPYFYTFDTSTRANGPYDITAEVTDSANATAAGNTIHVTVANPLPTAEITDPAPDATMSGANVAVKAEVAAGAGMALNTAVLKVDGNPAGSVSTAGEVTYTLDATTLPGGLHILTVTATDKAGNVTVSAPVRVIVSNPPPTVAITGPVANAVIAGVTVITADANAGAGMTLAKVDFEVDGALLQSVAHPGPYTVDLDAATLTSGGHELTVIATDTTGQAAISAAVPVSVA